MKKLATMLLAGLMCVGLLAGCGQGSGTQESTSTEGTESTENAGTDAAEAAAEDTAAAGESGQEQPGQTSAPESVKEETEGSSPVSDVRIG